MQGYLIGTNVVASLIAADSAPGVKAWAAAQDEDLLWLSIVTLGEYDKGIANLPDTDPARPGYIAARKALEDRFAGRIKRDTGHAPPVIDTLFAATAVEHGLGLVTRNVKDVAGSGRRC